MNSDIAVLLEQHFDTAFAAPDGIKKLRELILSLAMQGKLVPQDPSDPPASQLLKTIEAEKKRLVKEGKIKAPKPLPEIKPEEIPYALPKGWKWVRFGEIAQHNSGKTLDKGRNSGLPRDYITTSNLYWGRFELGSVRQMLIREDELEKCTAKRNDLLICEGGEAGRAAVWNCESEVCFQNHIHRARFYGDIAPYFAYRFFEKLNTTGEINQHRKGVGISNISSKTLGSIIYPLPPLPEQHRIVTKIDQLMARCDALEKLRSEREKKRRAVHAAALTQLLDHTGTGNPANACAFITQHFVELYAIKENVAELRKAILQLAVMGKLVPQDPNDPPARNLLKEIEAEKRRLVKEGKIKAPKPLPEIKPEDAPYVLPQGWEWVRLGSIAIFENGDRSNRYPNDTDHQPSGVPFFGAKDMVGGALRFDNGLRFINEVKFLELSNGKLVDKDFIILLRGTVGKMAIFRATDEFSTGFINAQMLIVRMLNKKMCDFFSSYSSSIFFQSLVAAKTTGSAVRQMPANVLLDFLIPLPPLPEQQRIVTKIDQLMTLCKALEQRIAAATGKQTELLNAVMAQL